MKTQKNMYRKTMVIIIIGLFIAAGVVPSIGGNETIFGNNDDELDQEQTDDSNNPREVYRKISWAQSFKTTFAELTRVELYMYNMGYEQDVNVSIRSGLEDDDLTNVTLSADRISNDEYSWIEFDFPDITVNERGLYYIVCTYISDDKIKWAGSYENPYFDGKAWYQKLEPLSNWKIYGEMLPFPWSYDLCFKTYGRHHRPNWPTEPEGPNQIKIRTNGKYSTSATDPDDDKIKYGWDWNDDDVVDEWTQYYYSDETCTKYHSWEEQGSFSIKVKAEDEHGFQSRWSQSKSVSVPKNKVIVHPFLNFLQQHPYMFPLLRQLLRLEV